MADASKLAEVWVELGVKSTLPADLATAKSQTEAFAQSSTVAAAKGASAFVQYVNSVHAVQQVFDLGKLSLEEYQQSAARSLDRLQRGLNITRESAVAMAKALAPSTPVTPQEWNIVRQGELQSQIDKHKGTKNELSQEFISTTRAANEEIYQKELSQTDAALRQMADGIEEAAYAEAKLNAEQKEFMRNVALATPIIERNLSAEQRLNAERARVKSLLESGFITRTEAKGQLREARATFEKNDPASIARAETVARQATEAEKQLNNERRQSEQLIQKNKTALQVYHEELARLIALRDHADSSVRISKQDFVAGAQRAEGVFNATDPAMVAQQEALNKAKQESIQLDQRGEQLKVQFATAQERHNIRMKEYEDLLRRNKISQDVFNRAQKESLDIQKAEASMVGRGGILGRSGGMLMAQGSYAIQDFATVISMKGMGMSDALRAASNNVGMMAMMLGGPAGSVMAALVTIGAIAPGIWDKFNGGVDSSKEAVDLLTRSLEFARKEAEGVRAMRADTRKIEDIETSAAARAAIKANPGDVKLLEADKKSKEDEIAAQNQVMKKQTDAERSAKELENAKAAVAAASAPTGPGEFGPGPSKEDIERLEAAKKAVKDNPAMAEDAIAALKKEQEKLAIDAKDIDTKIAAEKQKLLQLEKRLAELLAQEAGIADANNRSKNRELRETDAIHNKRNIKTTEDAEKAIKLEEDAISESDVRAQRLARDKRTAIREKKPEDVARIEKEIKTEESNRQRHQENKDAIQRQKAGLASSAAMDKMMQKELSYLDVQDRNRWAKSDPRLEQAEKRQRQLDDDLLAIKESGRSPDEQKRESLKAVQAADKEIKVLQNQGRQKTPQFMGADQLYKHIQEGLSINPVVEEQRKTNTELKGIRKDLAQQASTYT